MANLTLAIPDAAIPRISAAFETAYPDSGLSGASLVKHELIEFIQGVVKGQERMAIEGEARAQAHIDADANDAEVEAIPIA